MLLAITSAPAAIGAANAARADLLRRAEAELRQGESGAALDDFERAAMMRHDADAELGLIRAALQQGFYRRALAFCAHTAGEHLEETGAAALYAWLLRAGGQARFGERVLADALRRAPADPLLLQVNDSFRDDPLPVARGRLLDAPHRLAPWPVPAKPGQPLPGTTTRSLGGAVLIGDGSLAVAPLAAITSVASMNVGRIWVRNGLGQSAAVALEPATDRSLTDKGIALLRLAAPLPLASPSIPGEREPFAGSPGYVLRFAATAQAAWPWLSQGFLGGSVGGGSDGKDGSTGSRRLGFDTGGSGNPGGSPVFDASGRLAGMVMSATKEAESSWLPAAAWRAAQEAASLTEGALVPPGAATATPAITGSTSSRRPLVAPDAIYEAGLPLALQLLVEDR